MEILNAFNILSPEERSWFRGMFFKGGRFAWDVTPSTAKGFEVGLSA
jgi:hypothetical protein